MITPITPREVIEKFTIPDCIFEAVNELIVEKWDGIKSKIIVNDLIDRIITKDNTLTREIIFEKNYLDIELNFIRAGWKVEYNQPDRGENFKSHFLFYLR